MAAGVVQFLLPSMAFVIDLN